MDPEYRPAAEVGMLSLFTHTHTHMEEPWRDILPGEDEAMASSNAWMCLCEGVTLLGEMNLRLKHKSKSL